MNIRKGRTLAGSRAVIALSAYFVASINSAIGDPGENQEDVAAVYGNDGMISLATGYAQPLLRAPATATVLNRAEITALGARTLKDALHLLPGFQVSSADGRTTFVTVRGITSRALILVDNIPITRTMIDPWVALDNVLLHNVERIEVVRGPGSAIYGADAVAGVINILTRTGTHLAKREVGVASGWNETQEAWGLWASNLKTLKLSGYAAFTHTHGSDRIIEVDTQTLLDQHFGTDASRAPGPIAQERRSLDVRLDAQFGDFSAQVTYYDQDPLPNGAGVAYALDPTGEWNSRYRSAQVRYRKPLSEALRLESFIDYSEVRQDAIANIFPAGAFANAFPDGVQIWRAMILHAIASPKWEGSVYGSHRIDAMVIELLGMDARWGALAADATFAPLVGTMVNVFAQAADQWFRMPRVVRNFLYFVVQPAAVKLLAPSIVWISKAIASFSSYDWRDGIENSVVEFLRVGWQRERAAILANSEMHQAFFGLLATVVARGGHAAIALRDQIAGSGGCYTNADNVPC